MNQRSSVYFLAVLVAGATVTCAFGFTTAIQPYWSLVPSLVTMFALAIPEWRRLEAQRNWSALEEFADEIYICGYLMTLAALVGLVIRPEKSFDSSLRAAAGFKLISTMLGLVLRSFFRKAALEWREADQAEHRTEFEMNNQRLKDAASELNQAAGNLSRQFRLVVEKFDMQALVQVVNWSKLTAESFRNAGKAIEQVPARVSYFTRGLGKATRASQLVAASMGERAAPAVKQLASELNSAGLSASNLATAGAGAALTVDSLAKAGEEAADAMDAIAKQTLDNQKALQRAGLAVGQEIQDRQRIDEALRKNEANISNFTNELGRAARASRTVASRLGQEAIPAVKLLTTELNSAGVSAGNLATNGAGAATAVGSMAVAGEEATGAIQAMGKQTLDNQKALRRAGLAVGQEIQDRQRIDEALRKNEVTIANLTLEMGKVEDASRAVADSLVQAAVPAVMQLTNELNGAGASAGKLATAGSGAATAVGSMAKAGEGATDALDAMGKQASDNEKALQRAVQVREQEVQELARVDEALKKIVVDHSQDTKLPMNQLVKALDTASIASAESKVALGAYLAELVKTNTRIADQQLEYQAAAKRFEEQLDERSQTIQAVAAEVAGASQRSQRDDAQLIQLVSKVDRLCGALDQTVILLQGLAERTALPGIPHAQPVPPSSEPKPGREPEPLS